MEQAITLMDTQGTPALTLRRLARELGVEAPALYWHFADKGELCREVVRTVGEQLEVTSTTRGTPRRRLEHHFHAVRDHWRAHPGVLELSRQFPPSAAGRVARDGVALVAQIVGADGALDCYRSLSWTVTGFVILEQTLDQSVHHRRVGPTRWELDLDDSTEPSTFDTDELFRTTLGLALDGLEHRVA